MNLKEKAVVSILLILPFIIMVAANHARSRLPALVDEVTPAVVLKHGAAYASPEKPFNNILKVSKDFPGKVQTVMHGGKKVYRVSMGDQPTGGESSHLEWVFPVEYARRFMGESVTVAVTVTGIDGESVATFDFSPSVSKESKEVRVPVGRTVVKLDWKMPRFNRDKITKGPLIIMGVKTASPNVKLLVESVAIYESGKPL